MMSHPVFNGLSEEQDNEIKGLIDPDLAYESVLFAARTCANNFGVKDYVIVQRAFQLGLVAYSPFSHFLLSHRKDGWRSDEIDFLINHPTTNRKVLGAALGRTLLSVNKQCIEFRLTFGGLDYSWSTREMCFLKENLGKLSIKDFSQSLNRSAVDIKHQAITQGMAQVGCFKQFTGRPSLIAKPTLKAPQLASVV